MKTCKDYTVVNGQCVYYDLEFTELGISRYCKLKKESVHYMVDCPESPNYSLGLKKLRDE